jgi:hypothetical protein
MQTVAYFNKKIKIISGGSNVKIYNTRNVVDVRKPSTSTSNKSIASTSPWLKPSAVVQSVNPNALAQDNCYIDLKTGQVMSVGGGYEKNPFRYAKPNTSTSKGSTYSGVPQMTQTAFPTKVIPKIPWNIIPNAVLNPLGPYVNWEANQAAQAANNVGSSVGSAVSGAGEWVDNQIDETRKSVNLALIAAIAIGAAWLFKK